MAAAEREAREELAAVRGRGVDELELRNAGLERLEVVGIDAGLMEGGGTEGAGAWGHEKLS